MIYSSQFKLEGNTMLYTKLFLLSLAASVFLSACIIAPGHRKGQKLRIHVEAPQSVVIINKEA